MAPACTTSEIRLGETSFSAAPSLALNSTTTMENAPLMPFPTNRTSVLLTALATPPLTSGQDARAPAAKVADPDTKVRLSTPPMTQTPHQPSRYGIRHQPSYDGARHQPTKLPSSPGTAPSLAAASTFLASIASVMEMPTLYKFNSLFLTNLNRAALLRPPLQCTLSLPTTHSPFRRISLGNTLTT